LKSYFFLVLSVITLLDIIKAIFKTTSFYESMNETMEKLGEIQNLMQRVGKEDQAWMGAFQTFLKTTKKDGALSSKMKEIIGIAVSVKAQCERCIPWHVKNALDLGAKKEEIIEAAQVAVVLGGGPSLMYMKYVYDAIDALTQ